MRIITNPPTDLVKFRQLNVGDVFCGAAGEHYYMKINPVVTNSAVMPGNGVPIFWNCINLITTHMWTFDNDSPVTPVRGGFKVEE